MRLFGGLLKKDKWATTKQGLLLADRHWYWKEFARETSKNGWPGNGAIWSQPRKVFFTAGIENRNLQSHLSRWRIPDFDLWFSTLIQERCISKIAIDKIKSKYKSVIDCVKNLFGKYYLKNSRKFNISINLPTVLLALCKVNSWF